MNILFVSHCDFSGNSAMHIFSIANRLATLGVDSIVCVPNDATSIGRHGTANFQVVPYEEAARGNFRFPNGSRADLIHAWTPRELVRRLTEQLAELHSCPYIVHLEDNEEVILEKESNGRSYAELASLPPQLLDGLVPDHRSHPVRYRSFISRSAGVTALMDSLLEFKPADVPGMVFWPGFDDEFRDISPPSAELLRRLEIPEGSNILIYNGNIHDTNAAEVRSLFLAVQTLSRHGLPIKLLKTGWNHIRDQRWIEEAIACGAVRELGFLPRSELPLLFSISTLLVQPGKPDRFNNYRFPSKLPEFFVSGKPVILPKTNVGRFVRDGVEAVLLNEGTALEIAAKIERLINSPLEARKIGERGRAFALKRLSWQENVPAIKSFYEATLRRQDLNKSSSAVVSTTRVDSPVKLVAFYLPQFHPIKENDENWGIGFTEWTNVARARPNFVGHYQPQLPADLGFYDLRLPEVLEQQAELARRYGIHGFCFYYYWFNGRRLLERPLDNFLRDGRPNFPFCICWANENWTRRWDGSQDEILIGQDYSGDACERFIRDVIPILQDPRYIRVNGAPVLLVYRVNQIPDPQGAVRLWRQICAAEGIPNLHMCAVQSFGISDPRSYGFDAAVEFPPHNKRALIDPGSFSGLRSDFEGYLEDYPTIVENQLGLPIPEYIRYRGVMPAWDNTPRRGKRAHIVVHSSTEQYQRWLTTVILQALEGRSGQEPIIFINAWNEWAEGAYLEPDQQHGRARLAATLRALGDATEEHLFTVSSSPPTASRNSNGKPVINASEDGNLQATVERYRSFQTIPISHATVRDYCDSFDHLHELATKNGDLKDCQRPWILKAILGSTPRPGRVLEIGAGEPLVAAVLSKLGYEVWIVDPYDGSGNGPMQYEQFRKRYPDLKFVRSQFQDHFDRDLPEQGFDCIYSISVLEHVPPEGLVRVFAGLKKFLNPSGITIHAVDHVHRGNGAAEHLANLRFMADGFGFEGEELDRALAVMNEDIDTYYLSAESHNRWRSGVAYHEFPMRACVSVQLVANASGIRIPRTQP